MRNEHLMAESLIIFLKRFLAAFPVLEIHVRVRGNKNISVMVSRYKWKDTFCVLSNHMYKKKKEKRLLLGLLFC